jgi:hydroxyacylglutathione hydrolase
MRYKTVIVGGLETNCYLVYCETTRECAVVDPGAEHERIFLAIAEDELKPVLLVNTHGHVDHTGANWDVKEHFGTPIAIHAGDGPMLGKIQQLELSLFLGAKDSPPADRMLKDGDVVRIGNGELRVLHTPGHSAASASWPTGSCCRVIRSSWRAWAGPTCRAAPGSSLSGRSAKSS